MKEHAGFYLKTDHRDLFDWILKQVESDDLRHLFHVELKSYDLYEEAPDHFLTSFQTGFEKLFLGQGKPINALVLRRS
jgi:tRNA G46 methylase TrmB